MMKFNTIYDEHPRIFANPGNRKVQRYRTRYNELGQLELVPNGQDDLYDMIQSHADSVNIDTILSKFIAGDPDALSKVQGTFGDFTNLPTSYAEMLNVINESEQFFEQLPLEVRERFNHNFGEFISSMDSKDFVKRMGWQESEPAQSAPVQAQPVVSASSEVSVNE